MNIDNAFREDANVVIHNGDSLDFIKTIPDNLVSLQVTSPPYNIGKEYEDRTSLDEYFSFQEKIIKETVRICSNDGSICWQVGNFVDDGEVFPLDFHFYGIFKKLGMQLRNRIIWRFEHGLHTKNRFSGRYEVVLWFSKSDQYKFDVEPVRIASKYPGKCHYKGPNKGKPSGNPAGKNPSDFWSLKNDWEESVWNIPNVKANHPEKTIHPCQFPIELVERLILALSTEGDWVYDPFLGVGSTVIAALNHGRKAMGSEKCLEYYEEAINRLTLWENGQLKVRPLGKPVHTPSGKVSKIPKEWVSNEGPNSGIVLDTEVGCL